MNAVTMDDINYLAQQSSGRINMVLSGMTALMNDTDHKVAVMESQGWFQRMVKTVTGRNKLTQAEIQQNHDKLNAYMSEAIAELYNRNCISNEIMISLGTQLNELYTDHVQLKQMLGAFVDKLNKKIESVDNFHMLIEEISQGLYAHQHPIVSVVFILSMMDKRMLTDSRKCAIIIQAMRNKNILNHEKMTLMDCMHQAMSLTEEEAGRFYMEIMSIKENYFADMMLRLMDGLYFVDLQQQRFIHKKRQIQSLLRLEDYDENSLLSTEDFFDEFFTAKKDVINGLIPISDVQMESKLAEAEDLYLHCRFDEAFELFKTLAEKGNGRAMYFMGEYYVQTYGHVRKDMEEGKKWRQKGYELGDTLASLNVAFSFSPGSAEREEIFNKMFEPTLRLAEDGDVFAQNELADLYGGGYGVEADADEEKQIDWLKKSAENGFWRSMDRLGDLYKYRKEYAESVKWYGQAAQLGYASAQNNLANMLWAGNGVDEDEAEANLWYEKAAEQGYAAAQYNLGTSYYNGNGVEQDDQKAIYWIKQAAEQGYASAENKLAYCYDTGTGVDVDKHEAFQWYQKAAEHGLAIGQNNLAICYKLGDGTEKNIEKAKKWHRIAFENGCNDGGTQLGILAQEEGDYVEAVKWYRKAAENGDAEAQNRLGVRYDNGEGVPEDKVEAFYWFMKAAEQGHMKAQSNVGICYYYGTGIAEDEEKAKEWLRKSAQQGYEIAIDNLSEWFDEESGYVSNSSSSSSSGTITKDTLESIKTSCEVFVMMHDGAKYEANYKLKDYFGILYEDVYMGHDDTLFKSGKNGFAITENGIYCRDMMGSYTNHVSFETLANADNIYVNGSNIYADGELIAYLSGSNEERSDLKELFERIRMFAKVDLW